MKRAAITAGVLVLVLAFTFAQAGASTITFSYARARLYCRAPGCLAWWD